VGEGGVQGGDGWLRVWDFGGLTHG
jgi:hypothetical protein